MPSSYRSQKDTGKDLIETAGRSTGMGSVWSCLHMEGGEERGCLNASLVRNCICLRCLTQQMMRMYAALFLRVEVHSVSLSAQALAPIMSTDPVPDGYMSSSFRTLPRPLPYDDPRCSRLQHTGLVLRHDKSSSHFHEESELLSRNNSPIASESLILEAKCISNHEGGCKLSTKSLSETRKEITYIFSSEEEDVCPTCLDEYTSEDPKIIMQCSHHFHLGCIYEWMERSKTCPVCGKVMVFNERA